MLIGFIDDVHGRVFHAIAAVATWQTQTGKQLDLLIQVGDLGAFPDITKLDPATNRYLAADPAEADFSRLLQSENEYGEAIAYLREQFVTPIHFIRGNHEDFAWLHQISKESEGAGVIIDPFDLFYYVPDGTVLDFDGLRIGFLGGVEERADEAAIDQDAYQSLLSLEAGTVDLLVSHEGPYGSSIGFHGDTHGSKLISKLLEQLKPRYQVAGHAHSLSGPRTFGSTTYLGLDCIVASPIWYPEAQGLQPGCLAVLDTEQDSLSPVMAEWLSEFETPFEFGRWFQHFVS